MDLRNGAIPSVPGLSSTSDQGSPLAVAILPVTPSPVPLSSGASVHRFPQPLFQMAYTNSLSLSYYVEAVCVYLHGEVVEALLCNETMLEILQFIDCLQQK